MNRRKRSTRRAAIIIVLFVFLLAAAGAVIMAGRLYYPLRHVELVNIYSQKYGLEPAFVLAVINAESRSNDNAVSSVGASGLMQIMEDTAYWIAPKAGLDDFSYEQIFDPQVNIHLGCFYLAMHLERFGTLENALCAYNAGAGRLESWLADPSYSSDGKTLDVIPYRETRSYVERVMNYTKVYEFLLRFM